METIICGIAYECPHGKRKTECPLLEIEHLDFYKKVHFIDCLQPDQKKQIVDFHFDCSRKREYQ